MLRNVDRYNELKSKYPTKEIYGYYGNCQCSVNELIEKSESEIRYKDCENISMMKKTVNKQNMKLMDDKTIFLVNILIIQ